MTGVSKYFGTKPALVEVDLHLEPGESLALVGPDGAGKTTLLRVLLGLLSPDAGRVEIGGRDVMRQARTVRADFGYVSQQFSLYPGLTIRENIRFVIEARALDRQTAWARAHELLVRTELDVFAGRLARDLSGGMRRKLSLICALLHRPRLLVLDEPTTGVDPVSRREFWDLLHELVTHGTGLLISTPHLAEAERCRRVALMAGGRVLAIDTLDRLLKSVRHRIVEVDTSARLRTARVLQQTAAVLHVDLPGESVRVVMREGGAVEEVRSSLEFAGVPLTGIRTVAPTLGDVLGILSDSQGPA